MTKYNEDGSIFMDDAYLAEHPSYGRYWHTLSYTVLVIAFGYVGRLIFPDAAPAIILGVIILILSFWYGYNDTFIKLSHRKQKRTVLGPRATQIELRLAICAAASMALCTLGLTPILGFETSVQSVLMVLGVCATMVPLWFHVPSLKRHMLDCLKYVANLPFLCVFLVVGLVSTYKGLNRRHFEINIAARKVFGVISGYPSNLTFLMESQDILDKLPTRE